MCGLASQKKILIVDDSIDIRELLTLLFESQGYAVECRANGIEALELLNSESSLPAVILLDLRMPEMDGIDFIHQQKNSARLKNIPIIMMTAEDDVDGVKDKNELKSVISKPFSMKSILLEVNKSTVLH